MPTFAEHRRQVNHNESIFPKMLEPRTNACDWAITVMFYTALHFFDAYLDEKLGFHPQNHKERNKQFQLLLPGPWDHYLRLLNASKNARYKVSYLGPDASEYFKRLKSDNYLPLKSHFESI